MTEQQFLFALQISSLIISIISTVVISISLVYLARQTKATQEQSISTAQTNTGMMFIALMSEVLELDRTFISDPTVYKYFYQSKNIVDDDSEYPKIFFYAIMLLDFFDSALLQGKSFPQLWPENWWRDWIIEVFTTSPILRQTMEDKSEWFSQDLLEMKRIAEQRMKASGITA